MRFNWKVPALLFALLAAISACASSDTPEPLADEEMVMEAEPAETIATEPEASMPVIVTGSELGIEDVNRLANEQGVVVISAGEEEPFAAAQPPSAADRSEPFGEGRSELAGQAGQDPVPVPAARQEPPARRQDMTIDDARREIDLRKEKKAILAQQFVNQADNSFARGDYSAAGALYADAFQLDPGSRDARDGLRRTRAAMGDGAFDVASSEDLIGQQELRWARQRMTLEARVSEGDRLMAAGSFRRASETYRGAQLTLKASPNLAGGALDDQVIAGKLAAALDAQNDADSARRATETAAAQEEAAAEEAARRQYFDNRVGSLFAEANNQFSMGFYQRSMKTLDTLLDLDPRNEEALDLRDVSNQAWHAQRERRTVTSFREEWKRTFEDLRTLAVPPMSTIEFDVKYWREVVSKRKPLDTFADEEEPDAELAAIEAVLEETRIEPHFDNTVEEIAANLAAYTRINYVISRAVREDLDEDTKTIRFNQTRPMSVAKLHLIIEDLTNNEVLFVIRNGVVNVVTADEAKGGQVLRPYEVRDIVRPVQDFVAKEINLSPSGGIDETEEPLPERDANLLTDDDLLDAIQENIDPDSWGEENTISIENGTLIVYAAPGVQARVERLLNDLRKSANIMVEIKVRFLKVEDSFLEDIGIDFRGLGDDATAGVPGKGTSNVFDDFGADPGSPANPGEIGTGNSSGAYYRAADDDVNIIARSENLYDASLGDDRILTNQGGLSLQYTWLADTQVEMILRAVEKSKRSEIVTQPKLMVYNTARANLTIANQVSYVGDFDVQIAQAAAIADPIVRVAQDGVFLDVRPTVSADRRFIYIDVRPTVAILQRPIPTFQTSLGTGSPVTLQLPELELQKVRTPAIIPDGGTLLLGGMKSIDEQYQESGVPFLNKIPILSFFFSRKGTYRSHRKLIILLTATVVIPSEMEPATLPSGLSR